MTCGILCNLARALLQQGKPLRGGPSVTIAILLGQLALALGFLGYITRAVAERAQEVGLLPGEEA